MRPSLALELREVPLDVGGSTFEVRTLTLAASGQAFASVVVAARSHVVAVGRSTVAFYPQTGGPSSIGDPDSSTAQCFLGATHGTGPALDEESARLPFGRDVFDRCGRLEVTLSLSCSRGVCLYAPLGGTGRARLGA